MEGRSTSSIRPIGVGGTGSRKFKAEFSGTIPGGVQKCVDDTTMHVTDRVENGGSEGMKSLNPNIEGYKESTVEGKSQADEPSSGGNLSVPDMKKLGEYLDKTRDMLNERKAELVGDEERLAKARKAYPKVMEGLKKQFAGMRREDGETDLKKLAQMVSKGGANGMETALDAGEVRSKMSEGKERKEEGMKKGKTGIRKGLEEMKEYVGKGGDSEQSMRKKRDAKL